MNVLLTLFAQLLRNVTMVIQPGGSKSIIAENLLLKQQLSVQSPQKTRSQILANAATAICLLVWLS